MILTGQALLRFITCLLLVRECIKGSVIEELSNTEPINLIRKIQEDLYYNLQVEEQLQILSMGGLYQWPRGLGITSLWGDMCRPLGEDDFECGVFGVVSE